MTCTEVFRSHKKSPISFQKKMKNSVVNPSEPRLLLFFMLNVPSLLLALLDYLQFAFSVHLLILILFIFKQFSKFRSVSVRSAYIFCNMFLFLQLFLIHIRFSSRPF